MADLNETEGQIPEPIEPGSDTPEFLERVAIFEKTLLDAGTNPEQAKIIANQVQLDHLKLENRLAKAEQEALTDSLTGLDSLRKFERDIETQYALAERFNSPLTIMYIDLDFFKEVNDTLGHDVGDDVLKALAEEMRNSIRVYDLVARLGGDEFAIILPNTNSAGAAFVAERIRQTIEAHPFNKRARFSTSIGIADRVGATSTTQMRKRADDALYKSKETKNSVTVWEEGMPPRPKK